MAEPEPQKKKINMMEHVMAGFKLVEVMQGIAKLAAQAMSVTKDAKAKAYLSSAKAEAEAAAAKYGKGVATFKEAAAKAGAPKEIGMEKWFENAKHYSKKELELLDELIKVTTSDLIADKLEFRNAKRLASMLSRLKELKDLDDLKKSIKSIRRKEFKGEVKLTEDIKKYTEKLRNILNAEIQNLRMLHDLFQEVEKVSGISQKEIIEGIKADISDIEKIQRQEGGLVDQLEEIENKVDKIMGDVQKDMESATTETAIEVLEKILERLSEEETNLATDIGSASRLIKKLRGLAEDGRNLAVEVAKKLDTFEKELKEQLK